MTCPSISLVFSRFLADFNGLKRETTGAPSYGALADETAKFLTVKPGSSAAWLSQAVVMTLFGLSPFRLSPPFRGNIKQIDNLGTDMALLWKICCCLNLYTE